MAKAMARIGFRGLLGRLVRDRRGNTLAIVAAAMIPLTAMIGSGVDMARAYTVQARLQQACDAASLAGRRMMLHDAVDSDVTSEATKFFNFNFPQEMYGTTTFTPQVTRPASGAIKVTASTTLPTMVMQLFGYTTIPVNVDCTASQDFINADVMLVVDTTGSMDLTMPDGKKRIEALRAAVMALYDQLKPTQDFLEAHGYRLRYSILPYSQTVNVGKLLYAHNPQFLRNPGRYTAMTAYYNSGVYYFNATRSDGPTQPATWFTGGSYGGCIEERETLATAAAAPSATELADEHMRDLNIDGLPDPGNNKTQWQPYDPSRQTLYFVGYGYVNTAACPTGAVEFKAWTRNDLQNYVNSLVPNGNTYHDVGMLWGARMLSSKGPFAVSPDAFNGMRTNKYMVFLTDGQMEPNPAAYSAYGFEYVDRRIMPGGEKTAYNTTEPFDTNDQVARHNARFQIACTAARNMAPNNLYIIALATGITAPLSECVNNNTDRVKTAASQSELIAQFADIGRDISELRISQ